MTKKLLWKIYNKKLATKQMTHTWNHHFSKILEALKKLHLKRSRNGRNSNPPRSTRRSRSA